MPIGSLADAAAARGAAPENDVRVQQYGANQVLWDTTILRRSDAARQADLAELWKRLALAPYVETQNEPPNSAYRLAFLTSGDREELELLIEWDGRVYLRDGAEFLVFRNAEIRSWAGDEIRVHGSFQDDGGSPMLLFFVLAFLIVVGAAIALCLCGVAAGGVLIALGVFSSSLVAGLVARRASAGFRVFLAQLCLLFAIPAVTAVIWLVSWAGHFAVGWPYIVFSGVVFGTLAGLALAALVDAAFGILRRLLPARFQAW